MDKRYDKRIWRTRRRLESGNTHWKTQNTLKNINLENVRLWWNTCVLVQEIPLCYDKQALGMNRYLQGAQVPDLMTKGKTTLIQKNSNKGTAPNNYRPITCLPMMWKILTARIREMIYSALTSRGLFPEEYKGCRKGSRGTAELLYIDQHILNEKKTRRKDLAMAWIDYKKAYDMVTQSWIINCLKMYKISDEVITFIEKTMKTWRVELTTGGRSLAEEKILRGIFQGDALSTLKDQSPNVHGWHQTICKKWKKPGN